MSKVVIYKEGDGVSVVIPAPGVSIDYVVANDIPKDADYKVIDSTRLPADRTFRGAWDFEGSVDMDKARDIWRDNMRPARNAKLKSLDIEWMKAMENGEHKQASKIAAKKQSLRDVTDRQDINDYDTPEDLKTYWPQILED
tara:strand:- start:3 stop:425 length:423 start_codon:yes stop_codon:yes gene_type:complete